MKIPFRKRTIGGTPDMIDESTATSETDVSEVETDTASPVEIENTTENAQKSDAEPQETASKKTKKKKPKKLTKEEQLQQEIDDLKHQLAAKETELEKKAEIAQGESDRALRAQAELENFKKRKEQEAIEFRKYANENFVTDLLPVLDSFDRAVEHIPEDQKKDETLNGFIMIQKQFHSMLEKIGVEKIEALNQPFDPNLHQAVGQEPSDEIDADVVLKEYQAGYKLNTRIIRPSMVVVSTR